MPKPQPFSDNHVLLSLDCYHGPLILVTICIVNLGPVVCGLGHGVQGLGQVGLSTDLPLSLSVPASSVAPTV